MGYIGGPHQVLEEENYSGLGNGAFRGDGFGDSGGVLRP